MFDIIWYFTMGSINVTCRFYIVIIRYMPIIGHYGRVTNAGISTIETLLA